MVAGFKGLRRLRVEGLRVQGLGSFFFFFLGGWVLLIQSKTNLSHSPEQSIPRGGGLRRLGFRVYGLYGPQRVGSTVEA